MHGFVKMAEKNLKNAEISYEKNRTRPGITDVELGNLVQKMEYARVVHDFILKNYGGR